jgi:hypothetical protein
MPHASIVDRGSSQVSDIREINPAAGIALDAWLVMKKEKDGAYLERNKCVAFMARTALELGYRTGTARTAIEGWSTDWHGCVYIDLPTGQVSWHYHDSQAWLFSKLPAYEGTWDGHDTPEKYRRVLACVGVTEPSEGGKSSEFHASFFK